MRARPHWLELKATANTAAPSAGAASSSSAAGSLSLPSVSINGATGHQLDTPLGTVVTFTRGGISYTLLGSVPSSAADLAAQAL